MSVTRDEIADHVRDAFGGVTPLTSHDLLVSARQHGARPEVLSTLEYLRGTYTDVRALWPDLPGIPVGSGEESR